MVSKRSLANCNYAIYFVWCWEYLGSEQFRMIDCMFCLCRLAVRKDKIRIQRDKQKKPKFTLVCTCTGTCSGTY